MSSIESGTLFGPYQIIGHLSSGGMGEIYRARDTRLGRTVAIKVLSPALSKNPDRVRRFEQEARATSALNHPGLITVYDFGDHNGREFIVLELIEGQTLKQKIARGPLSQRVVTNLGRQITDALAAAHAKGIIHRDLKPDNIFVTTDNRIKILDFGIAKLQGESPVGVDASAPTMDSPTKPGIIIGSLGYMAPEQIRGKHVDHRADIFAVGLVLYEMLTGSGAFQQVKDFNSIGAILTEEPPEIEELPEGLGQIVRHCLEKEPANRFQSMRDLSFALDSSQTGTGSTQGPGLSVQLRKHWKRSRAAILLTALVLSTVFISVTLVRRPPPLEPATYQRLTFHRGHVTHARFAPDGENVIYSAAWEGGPHKLWTTGAADPESRALELDGEVLLSVSNDGQLAILQDADTRVLGSTVGTLATASLSGAAARPLIEDVKSADFAPDGSLLIVRLAENGTRIIEYPPGTTIYTTPNPIREVRLSPDGSLAAVLRRESRIGKQFVVEFVDKAGNISRAPGSIIQARGAAWISESELLVMSEASVGSVIFGFTIEGERREMLRFDGTVRLLDYSRESGILVARDDYREGIVIGSLNSTRQRDYSWLDGSGPSAFTSDGKGIVFSEFNEGGGDRYASYIRPLDDTPAVRLGDGYATSISPDGAWVLSVLPGNPPSLVMLPTGAGSPRTINRGAIIDYGFAQWLPDGERIVIAGRDEDNNRTFVQNVSEEARPEALPAGLRVPFGTRPAAPDSKRLVLENSDGYMVIYDLVSKEVTRPAWSRPDLVAAGWTSDSTALYIFIQGEFPGRLSRTDIATGATTVVAELAPPDLAGVFAVMDVITDPTDELYAYGYLQNLSQLMTVRTTFAN